MGLPAALSSFHLAAALALCACTAFAQGTDEPPLRIVRQVVIAADTAATSRVQPTHRLRLSLAVLRGAGWDAAAVVAAAQRAAAILGQCAIRADEIELTEFEGPSRYRSVFTPVSRELAKRLALPRPILFFLADTRNQPAFDAEAVGRGNSRGRPEMADTVWIALGTRDLPLVIAHELAHVLANSGEHSDAPGNLMQTETATDRTVLTDLQCSAIRDTAAANGLLQPLQ
jgi:Zn-dependent protease with chaperone function